MATTVGLYSSTKETGGWRSQALAVTLQPSNKDISYNACHRILIEECPEVTGRLITVFRIF
jgi:hypothetical protein